MQRFTAVFLLVLTLESFSAANDDGFPLLNPGGIGGIFKGPHSETIIRGPDGSEITSEEKSGAIVRGDHDNGRLEPIVVAETVPVVPVQEASPLLTTPHEVPPLPPLQVVPAIEIVQQDPHVIETEIVPAPDVEPEEQGSDLRGPSGRIVTKGSASIVSGPASTTITEPRKIVVASAKFSLPEIVAAPLPLPLPLPLSVRAVLGHLVPPAAPSPTASVLQYSAPEPTYPSSTVAPSLRGFESTNIDLGEGVVRDAIPVVEYGSANGAFGPSTAAPLISSTPAREQYVAASSPRPVSYQLVSVPASTPEVPASYPVAEAAPSSQSANVQRIAKAGENVAVNGRVGDLARNEIVQLPDLRKAKYIAPALARSGIDASQVDLAPVAYSEVIKLAPDAYRPGPFAPGQARYQRRADIKETVY